MRPQEILAKKRDGGELSSGEIDAFIDGVCDKSWTDYQISALLMAFYIHGLNLGEQDALTHAMLHSGEVLDFSEIDKPKADKHSTGGVGDKTSLIIAPIAAACGIAVPMISGRGLGHTGGTLDKLEAIPGYNVKLPKEEFRRIINECGYAMAGQTAEIAPADKKLYALRDATATVPCIPLIVASIMSKKLAEGLDALLLDVKTGSGAFMQGYDDSLKLAEALVKTGTNFGVKTEAVISDMSQPLGEYVGNALETFECIKILRGEKGSSGATLELSLELTARLLLLADVSKNVESAREMASAKLNSGDAFEKFRQNVELQGGDPKVCDNPEQLLDDGILKVEIKSELAGIVTEIATLAIGNAIAAIGGGRNKADDRIDHGVGYASHAKIGESYKVGDPFGVLYCRTKNQADSITLNLRNAYRLDNEPVLPQVLVKTVIS